MSGAVRLLKLGETILDAYRGDRGAIAYDHSQYVGNPHETTWLDLLDKPTVFPPEAHTHPWGDLTGVSSATPTFAGLTSPTLSMGNNCSIAQSSGDILLTANSGRFVSAQSSVLTGGNNTILSATWALASNLSIQLANNQSYQFSSTTAQGTTDAKITRPSTGLVQVQADNGLTIKNLAGTALATLSAATISGTSIGVYPYVVMSNIYGGFGMGSSQGMKWAATDDYTLTKVLGINRDSSNNVEINNGTLVASGGSYAGLKAGAINSSIASSSDVPANAPLTIRNSSSTVGTTTGLWAFSVGHPGSYDGNMKITGPLQTSQNQWTLQFQDHATASQRGISTPGWMSATQFRSTVVGLGDVELLSWNGTGANYNGTSRVGLNHPYGTHPVEVVISRASGHASNTSGTKFYVIDGDGTEWFSVSNTGQLVFKPPSSATPASNGHLTIEATSNTQLTFKLKGSDGTVRSGSLTLS